MFDTYCKTRWRQVSEPNNAGEFHRLSGKRLVKLPL